LRPYGSKRLLTSPSVWIIHGNYMLKERTCNFHVIIREFVINFIFNNSDIFGGISLNPIILRQNNKSMEIQPKFVIELDLIYVNR